MNAAPLYSRSNLMQRQDALHVLKRYSKLVRWSQDEEAKILDVGCGDGNVTVDILLPFLPENVRKVVGMDISEEMLDFAKKYHSNGERVKYIKADISDKDAVEEIDETYDHIFSFFCLHWVQNQRKCAENLYDLLKPNGDMLLTFLASNPIFDVYENLSKYPKWSEYMWDVDKYISPYHHCREPEITLSKTLKAAGFQVDTCKTIDRVFVYPDLLLWRKAIAAVSPFLARIPEHLRKEYEADFLEEVKQMNCVSRNENTNEDNVLTRYKLFVVHAHK